MCFIVNKLDTNNLNFFNYLNNILYINKNYNKYLENYIKNIIHNIKNFKDKALLYYTKKFDKLEINNIKNLKVPKSELEKSFLKLDLETKFNLECIKNRIEIFHEKQKFKFYNNWKFIEYDGNILGQKLIPIEKIGVYIPGGKAIYPSSIFMNCIPAKIAGVNNITATIPLFNKEKNNLILGASFLNNIDNLYTIGGSQAIAALTYGTNLVNNVDKIFGPGNIYVAISKKIVFGDVGIDMIAGPSEIVFLSETNNISSDIIAMDLFSQSEHDQNAQSIFISDNESLIFNVEKSIIKLLPLMSRKNIIYNSLINKCVLIKVNNMSEAYNIINFIAPEHLILISSEYKKSFKYIKNFGSIFLDKYTSESFGDYSSGLNHVIPTSQNTKFSSPLGVYDFLKKSSFLKISNLGFNKLSKITSDFALKENLFSHSESIKFRYN